MPENDLLAWADKQTLSGAFGINPSITTDGVPAIGWYIGKLDVNAGAKKITLTESNGAHRTWTNTTDAGEWTEWVPQANATPPQEFDLPLADGLQSVTIHGSNKYWKNQFNEVGIIISVTKTDVGTNDIENTSLLATLPAGFRPATIVSGAAFVDRGEESVVYPAFIAIHPDGSVIINQSNRVSCSLVVASMSFLAAN